jgi:hypothetical protein
MCQGREILFHHSILQQIVKEENKTQVPFKFNPKSLEDAHFKSLVCQIWRKYDSSNGNVIIFYFEKI